MYVAAHDRIEELVERGLGTLVQRRMESLVGVVWVCLDLFGFDWFCFVSFDFFSRV